MCRVERILVYTIRWIPFISIFILGIFFTSVWRFLHIIFEHERNWGKHIYHQTSPHTHIIEVCEILIIDILWNHNKMIPIQRWCISCMHLAVVPCLGFVTNVLGLLWKQVPLSVFVVDASKFIPTTQFKNL